MGNILAIVGRPNVGKSTFFNRLTGTRQAIVDSVSGVTRDRHYGKSDWNGIEFSVIDTGGYIIGSDDVFEAEIRKQVEISIDEADIILFMVDVKDGLSGLDEDVAGMLRKSRKKVFLVVNKVDNTSSSFEIHEFHNLGLGDLYGISAINGSGTGDLLDDVVKEFQRLPEEDIPDLPKFAVVGRPNVGKSSFINALLGEERNIVTPVAGTTRDSIYTEYSSFGFKFLLVDTAGVRKKGKVNEDIEFYSVLRSIRAIEHSDVCLVMVDACQGFESQDINIFQLAQKNFKGIVIIVNKWDLVEKETNTHLDFEKRIYEKIAPFIDVPIVNETIPHELYLKHGAAKVLLKPARRGKGVSAGGAVRMILELAGIKNVTSKILGTNNKVNIVKCTIKALDSLKKVEKKQPKAEDVKNKKVEDDKKVERKD